MKNLIAYVCLAGLAAFGPAGLLAVELDYLPEAENRYDWVTNLSNIYADESAKRKEAELLFLGDSITWQWKIPRDSKFPGGLDTWRQLFPKAVNYGISGDRIEHLLWRITEGKNLNGCRFRVIVLMIGTNNIIQSKKFPQTPERIAHGIGQIIREIRQKQPDSRIVLLSVPPLSLDGAERDRMPELINSQIVKLADEKQVFFLDITDCFKDKDHRVKNLRDGVHPSPEGYAEMGKLLKAKIAEVDGK